MSASNGSFAAPITPDLNKEAEAFLVRIAAGAGVLALVNPTQPQSSFTAFNVSNNWIRLGYNWSPGIISLGAASARVSLIPPGGTFSADGADEGATDSAPGAIGFVDSIAVTPVDVPVAAGVTEGSTLTAAAAAQAGYVAINFLTA
jgi:hypothetical protein